MINDEEFNQYISELIVSLIQLGVPTTIVASAFEIDTLEVKNLQATLRIKQYGSSEIAELLQSLMFEAYEEAVRSIRTGSPAVKSRMISLILSKSLALVGKQAPETFERMRAEMADMFGEMKQDAPASIPLYATPTYSPSDADTDDGE